MSKSILWAILILPVSCQNKVAQVNSTQPDLVFKDSLGNTLNKSDLADATGKFNYEVMDNNNINSTAKKLHAEARALGGSGKYDLSISKLEQAIKMQPDWAYPVYDLAYTYLLKGDNEKALEFYQQTDKLEPKGFFTAKTAIYALEGEKQGRFPKGIYMNYLQIEWTDVEAEKLQIARAITQRQPDFAPAWKELASLSEDKAERLKAIETGLSKNPDAETKGILLLNKAAILENDGKKQEAEKILGDYIFSPDATVNNIELARYTLKSISESK